MSDPEVLDLTVDEEDKKNAPKLDLAALAREREARRQSRGDDGGDAKRARVASTTPAAPTGDAPSLRPGWFTRSGCERARQQQITFPCPTVSPRAVLRALRRENLGFYRAIDDKTSRRGPSVTRSRSASNASDADASSRNWHPRLSARRPGRR